MVSPFVYFAGRHLSETQLHAACLDGDLIALGEGFMPADLVETPAVRAASLAPLLGANLAASHLSAAWVHGGVDDPPRRHAAQRAVPRRLHHIVDHRLIYRDARVPAEDVIVLGGVAVTAVARTVADLAREASPAALAVLAGWARRDPRVIEDGAGWLQTHPGVPNRRTAAVVLGRWRGGGGQDDVTR